jgi:beta-fructofuranosidase
MKCISIVVLLLIAGAASAANTDKTLVSWVTLSDKNVRAGSVLTVQAGNAFDGIIFAERAADKWMAGSEGFARTGSNPGAFPAETADKKTQIQMGIVYKGDQITIYRNAEPYASYKVRNIDLLGDKTNFVVFGLRHIGGDGSISGAIDDARIYSKALTADELKSLTPNKASSIKPYAWWDFESDKVVDRAERYPHSKLGGGAKIAGGKLVLGNGSALLCAATEDATKITGRPGRAVFTGPYIPETPAWKEDPPEDWLTYHLAHPGPSHGGPGDPNPAFYYKGRYHLHYIYKSDAGGGCAFGHVSSTDMVHWEWHPTVLVPRTTGHGMYSGTGFFTKDGRAAMIYHGQGSGRNHIAYALDDNMDKWTKPEAIVPKDKDGNEPKMRHWDPDLWQIGDTYYALSGGKAPELIKSDDLKNWTHLGKLLHDGFPADLGVTRNEDISCANMFKIGNKWMLLCISHGLGCRYYLGDFKDEKYLPEYHERMSHGVKDYFAPESLLTKDGRRVMWTWVFANAGSLSAIQALPRELELPKDGKIRIKPLRELKSLRADEERENKITVKSGEAYKLEKIAGDSLEIELKCEVPVAQEYGVDVMCDEKGENGVRISLSPENNTLKVGGVTAPFELKAGEKLTLRIFIDKHLVEVFANDIQAVFAKGKYDAARINTRLFSNGGDFKVESVTAWKMNSIHYSDPIHFKPKLPTKKTVGDVMPFYWKGEYHVFYLTNPMGNNDVNWEHCSSTDLINWKEYPPALKPDPDDPAGPEGCCMFTGCVVEKDGTFYAWYTSWNPRNPKGREFLSLATSKDLITWEKHPEHMIAPDGIHYANHRMRDFRDPQIFWNEEKKEYWMHLLANEAKPDERGIGRKFGLLISKDLIKWTQQPSVDLADGVGGDECPDYFRIGDTHYIHGCRRYYYSDNINGPYKHPKLMSNLDRINAAKRVWDGKRHVWFGGHSGGVMPIPREVYAGPNGLLYMKPVEEVPAFYKTTALNLSGKALPSDDLTMPAHYMLDGELNMSPESSVSLVLGGRYRMTLDAAAGKMSLTGGRFSGTRACPVDTDKPVKVQIFTEGALIECFVNDQFAMSGVAETPLAKKLKIEVKAGNVELRKLLVKTP